MNQGSDKRGNKIAYRKWVRKGFIESVRSELIDGKYYSIQMEYSIFDATRATPIQRERFHRNV